MLLRGTKRVATISELAPSTSTGSVFCGDWAATKFGRAKQANTIKFAAAAGSPPVIGRLMALISSRKYLSGITISTTWTSTKHECESFGQPQPTQYAHKYASLGTMARLPASGYNGNDAALSSHPIASRSHT